MNQNENINSCPLCCAIDDRPLFIGDVNVNTILGHSGNFLIIPALGPLVVGHVLVVSSQHAEGLRYLTPEVQQNYKRLSAKLREYCAQFKDTVLEAEHGASSSSIRGPCIRHTHIHIFPGLGGAARIFDGQPNLLNICNSISAPAESYLWVNNGDYARTYDASQVIGQEIRQTLGKYLSMDDWDWAVNPKTALVDLTIKYWSGIREWLA